MKQITENYCSFEIAKLLKEKGFKNEYCDNMLLAEDGDTIWKFATFTNRDNAFDATMKFKKQIPLVTHQMALKWLREVHDLHIVVYPWQADNEEKAIHWCCKAYKSFAHLGNDVYTNETPKSYEQAVEAALNYVLKNLI